MVGDGGISSWCGASLNVRYQGVERTSFRTVEKGAS